ncbi:uncharacterized protein LOC131313825 [Rhododendron vialii]|uniref:uncharacterized protein LOC131313825 n=1 Tax=Rhododendron vialii TaxID=182163 RepID=UPI00265EF904|nr:uncharacterized protein LOC131313825 [Rhododendron vialii]
MCPVSNFLGAFPQISPPFTLNATAHFCPGDITLCNPLLYLPFPFFFSVFPTTFGRETEREREREKKKKNQPSPPLPFSSQSDTTTTFGAPEPPPPAGSPSPPRPTSSRPSATSQHHLVPPEAYLTAVAPFPEPLAFPPDTITSCRAQHHHPTELRHHRQNLSKTRSAGREVPKMEQKCRTIRKSSILSRKKLKTLVSVRIVTLINLSRFYFGSF